MPLVRTRSQGRRAPRVGAGRLSELLRPALELAVAIARRDAAASPPVEPPRRLRPFLSMRRLSTTALEGVRRAVDESPGLLERVAAGAPTEEDAGGRASWLFLHRPEGWEDELASLEDDAAASVLESSARRRLPVVEEEVRQVSVALADAREVIASFGEVGAELVEERRLRAAAEATLAALQGRVAAIEHERDAAHRRVAAADKALADALAAPSVDAMPTAHEAVAAAGADDAIDSVDAAEVRSSLTAARAAVAAAVDALDEAVASLDRRPSPPSPPRERQARPVPPRPVRLPAPLPPGVFDDDPAAADHLVRLPSALLLVDGYNLSLRRWGDLPLPDQRARLVDALNALAARTGVDVEVVFDGEEDSGRGLQSSGGRRQAVRVTFSADAVDADEVLLALVARTPISRPVVVATDDRRVQREAGARGANVVGSAPLFVVLGVGR